MSDAYTADTAREDALAEQAERELEKREEQLTHVRILRRLLKAGMVLTRLESTMVCEQLEELLEEKING